MLAEPDPSRVKDYVPFRQGWGFNDLEILEGLPLPVALWVSTACFLGGEVLDVRKDPIKTRR